MKAIAWTNYGDPDVLKLIKTKRPKAKNDEVLIKIYASTVTIGDARLRSFDFPLGFWLLSRFVFGLFKPRKMIPGMDISGEIVSIGCDVTLFDVGDCVYGTAGMHLGAYAEYVCLSEKSSLVKKPTNLTYQESVSMIFGGLTAIHFLKNIANIQKGQKVLINGASGGVGTSSIQLAKYLGADVIGICSAVNIELVKSLGANKVIDYNQEDIMKTKKTYDVILDTVGNLSLDTCKVLLNKNGKLILINTDLLTNLSSLFRKNLICGVAEESKKNLEYLNKLIESGHIKAVIDKVYPLEEIVKAHSYVDKGHKKGNVVLSII